MANNFKNSFVSVSSAGEYYQSTATDSLTGPQTVYTANNGSGVNSILIELDAANTGDSAITVTAFVQDTSATLGSITSISSTSDTATVTCGGAHGLQTGMYVNVTGSSTNYVNGIYKITRTGATTFTYIPVCNPCAVPQVTVATSLDDTTLVIVPSVALVS